MIKVTENDDGSLTIDWDENDPVESQLNHWSEEDFVNAIREGLKWKEQKFKK